MEKSQSSDKKACT